MSQSAPALGTADAEIKVAHARLSDVLINTLRRSEYSFACFARCREFGLSGPLPPKGGRWWLMFPSCLESQVCHLIPRSYVFFFDLILLLFSVLCIVLFLLMVSSLDFTPENPPGFYLSRDGFLDGFCWAARIALYKIDHQQQQKPPTTANKQTNKNPTADGHEILQFRNIPDCVSAQNRA